MHAAEFRRCLVDLDVAGIRALWRHTSPHLPQPATDDEALATMHAARTTTESIPVSLRCYSHRWLCERGLPSRLPDALLPAADRLYPRIVDGVGVAVKSRYPEVVRAVRGAMSGAVADAYAEGRTDAPFVKARMMEARARERRGLGL